jgi:L-aspartate oxidase
LHQFDPRAELAPRDIVARAIDPEMKRLGCESVPAGRGLQPRPPLRGGNVFKRCPRSAGDGIANPMPYRAASNPSDLLGDQYPAGHCKLKGKLIPPEGSS